MLYSNSGPSEEKRIRRSFLKICSVGEDMIDSD